jgi:uncharacterized protein
MRPSHPIIDAHVTLGYEPFKPYHSLTTADLLAQMDAHGVSLSIARPGGNAVAYFNERGNRECLGASPRVKALATATPWAASDASAELERSRQAGAAGLYLHPSRQGFLPSDDVARPLLDFASAYAWPVVFHTGTYIQSDVLAVAEVARGYPSLTILCDCAGFTDMWFELPGLLADLPNLNLIASLIWPRAIANTIKNYGASRVLFGSGSPRDSLTAAIERIERLELSDDDYRAVMHDNAARIFRLGEE